MRYWQRVPILIRAIAAGLFVYAIAGLIVWGAVITLVPAPWSLALMVGVLWVYWKYFSGSWWPQSTAAKRRESFRATGPPVRAWTWGLTSALLVVAAIQSGLVVTFRLVEFPADAWALGVDFSEVPRWLAWCYVVLMASVAGITEEVGFRGYMQVPLEKRYGPLVGITVVAVAFTVLHLNQAWAPLVLVHLFFIGVMWGSLAYASRSLVPGIVSHTVADVINFSYWWTDLAGRFDKRPVAVTGIDRHFIVWVVILVASIVLFIATTRKTLRASGHTKLAGPGPAFRH